MVLLLVFVFLAASCLITVIFSSVNSHDSTLDFLSTIAGIDTAKYRIEEMDVPGTGLRGYCSQLCKKRFSAEWFFISVKFGEWLFIQ